MLITCKYPLRATLCLGMMLFLACSLTAESRNAGRPNIILIITDDQGYGDIGAHGNMMIRTPNLDRLHAQSVRLTDYHVDPTCSPTRSALMTGRYSSRTGVWHTIMGRSIMAGDELTVAETLRGSGYHTAMFGKWHLGDNAPSRPQDQGFDYALYHGGGGVWQTPDYYGNDYSDDTYFEMGEPRKFTGYCTDVWFREAINHMGRLDREKPFFIYLATNAPHGPFRVDPKYSDPYKDQGVASPMAEFYGMITNIDENIGRLRKTLADLGIEKNTLLLFTTDNGTAAGVRNRRTDNDDSWTGFNMNMRGTKGSEYDGGHRVPFFAYWPDGGISGGRDVEMLTAHIDIHPTLAEVAGATIPQSADLDGSTILPQLRGASTVLDRTLVVHSQRIEFPEKWRKSAVMTPRWRLVNGRELFDIQQDPSQKLDLAGQYPQIVSRLRSEYEAWWDHIDTRFDDYVRINLGDPAEPEALLTCHDWHPDEGSGVPWNQSHIENQPFHNGFWAVEVQEAGQYEFILRQKPAQEKYILTASTAAISIQGHSAEEKVPTGATGIRFILPLEKGRSSLYTTLTDPDGRSRGAFFIEVRRL